MKISRFKSEKSVRPTSETWDAATLRSFVERPLSREEKSGSPGWSPVSYRPGTTRAKANVEKIYAGVLDIDGGASLEDTAFELDLSGFEYAIHTTFSHRNDGQTDRFRVILPLAEPVPAEAWPGAFQELCRLVPGAIGPEQAKDASRFFYTPIARPGAPYVCRYSAGAPLRLPTQAAPKQERPALSGETISAEHLRKMLAQIDVEQFHDAPREEWLKVMLEAHAATGGSDEGFAAFADWSAGDEDYAGDVDDWEYQWEHAHGDRPGDRTLASLIARVVAAGGSVAAPPEEDFDELPELPPPPPATPLATVSLEPFNLHELETRPWLVNGLLLDGQVALLVAQGGTGKSLLSLQLAAMVARGGEWAHWRATKPVRALVLSAEDDLDEMRRRMASVRIVCGYGENELAGKIHIYSQEDMALLKRERANGRPKRTALYEQVVRTVEDGGFGLLVVDPLIEMSAGLDENDSGDMKELITALREIARRSRIPVLAAHHAKKGGLHDQNAQRGSTALTAGARVSLILSAMDPDEAKGLLPPDQTQEWWKYVKLGSAKSNYGARGGDKWLKTVSTRIGNALDGGDECPALVAWAPSGGIGDLATSSLDAVLGEINTCARLPEGMRYRSGDTGGGVNKAGALFAESLGLAPKHAQRVVRELVQTGRLVEREYSSGRKVKYGLFLSDAESERVTALQVEQGQLDTMSEEEMEEWK